MIVTNHFTGHGLNLIDYDFDNPNSIFNWLLRGIGYMGTNLFILISAYFMCRSKFKTKKLLLLIAQTIFYSVTLYLITYIWRWHNFNVIDFVKSFFPITLSTYWFITCYVALFILSPFINKFIQTLVTNGKTYYIKFLIILFIFFSVIPTFIFFSPWINWGNSSGIVWFVVLYFFGGYIRYFITTDTINKYKRKLWTFTILSWILPLISKLIIAYFSYYYIGEVYGSSIFYMINSVLIFPASLLTFISFFTINIKSEKVSKFINTVATGVFAVYLIQDHSFIREELWSFVSSLVHPQDSIFMLETIIVVLSIFILSILIDYLRKFIFNAISYTGIPQKMTNSLIEKLDKTMNI